ncbi:excinuclease ABC subunit B [Stakelama sp. CBK3Z-3]|uniref:Excinuclease ABC subunit B n=1 Tax=Stakelama flava TaxID=2860338 RepID=A0ABS6XNY2_9SPHN|nr:excinuclease ABC subunit B [Stakelama flava]MBW4331907.1 excinuclease ABC subunit B [Stakelama flava]
MQEAAAREDFAAAANLRNRLMIARQTGRDPGEGDYSGITRQQPGKMGLGSQAPGRSRPKGWKPPKKPDPMTGGRGSGH